MFRKKIELFNFVVICRASNYLQENESKGGTLGEMKYNNQG